ncbi:MAG: helix-turn-helix domain containing protein [Chloroflexi bacterium]|nr:helix-turn-helix domain containing protein [Chloroflexota bacterium]
MRLRRPCKDDSAARGRLSVAATLPACHSNLARYVWLTAFDVRHNLTNAGTEGSSLTAAEQQEDKSVSLRRYHALNPRAQAVTDPAFSTDNPFFDARDLVQVKYEMLRRVRQDGQSVSETAAAFGFSRPSFYQAQALFERAGLPGLVPQRPGPRHAHKLSEEVVDVLEQALARESTLSSAQLSRLVEEHFGLRVHRRSVERALARRKKGLQAP